MRGRRRRLGTALVDKKKRTKWGREIPSARGTIYDRYLLALFFIYNPPTFYNFIYTPTIFYMCPCVCVYIYMYEFMVV